MTIRVPSGLGRKSKGIHDWPAFSAWAKDIDDSRDEIIRSLKDVSVRLAPLLSFTSESTVGRVPRHAATHRPASGTDPLATGIAGPILSGDTAATGTANSFSRSDHRHSFSDLFVIGPAVSVLDNIATYSNITGDIKDSGKSISAVTFGPATSQVHSVPRFDSSGLGDIEDPNILILDAADLHPETHATIDLGTSGRNFRDLYLSRFAYVDGCVFAGTGTTAFAAPVSYVPLLSAGLQSVAGPALVGLAVFPEYDTDSAAGGILGSVFGAAITNTWDPDLGGGTGNIDVITVALSGGRAAPVWTGTVSAVSLFSGSINFSAPELISTLNGFAISSLQITTTAPTQSTTFNIGTGNGTRHYGINSNSDIRLRTTRELWFGQLIETATPINSIRAQTAAGSNLLIKLNSADEYRISPTAISPVTNGGWAVGANGEGIESAWFKDTAAAFETRLLFTNTGIGADNVWTVDLGNASRTLTMSGNPTLADWFNQGVKSTNSPTFVDLSVDNITITDAKNIILATTTGTKIGTGTTQKLGFWNAAPVAQHSATGELTGFTANASVNPSFNESTWTGNVGSTAYTMSDVVKALKNAGIMAS